MANPPLKTSLSLFLSLSIFLSRFSQNLPVNGERDNTIKRKLFYSSHCFLQSGSFFRNLIYSRVGSRRILFFFNCYIMVASRALPSCLFVIFTKRVAWSKWIFFMICIAYFLESGVISHLEENSYFGEIDSQGRTSTISKTIPRNCEKSYFGKYQIS